MVAGYTLPDARRISASSIQASDAAKPSMESSKPYLKYVEGLRGVAVLFVVLDHVFRSTLVFWPYTGWKANLRDGLNWVSNGRASLAFFITLSGYLLMRQVIANDGRIGDWAEYLRRRAGRLLPAYFAAFIGSLLLIRLAPLLQTRLSVEWQDALPISGPGSIKMVISHFMLIDNFSYRWAFKADPPIWVVATQWQIYLLFPLLLLPLWRRIGMTGTVVVSLVLGLGIFLATGKGHAAAPWFLTLFAFGMAAAARERNRHGYERRFYGWLAAILFVAYAGVTLAFSFGKYRFLTLNGWEGISVHWFFDSWISLATACLLIFASATDGHWLLRCLSRRWLMGIGAISYSLYLIHDPLLAVMKIGLDRAGLGQYEQFGCYLVLGVPVLLAISWVFNRIFEKPFVRRTLRLAEPP
jgi:peptidoglycan/LPS O-acetylase OafA/YrhL